MNDKTRLILRKHLKGTKLSDEEKLYLENTMVRNSMVSKIAIKVVKSWITWVITTLSGIAGELTGIINLIGE